MNKSFFIKAGLFALLLLLLGAFVSGAYQNQIVITVRFRITGSVLHLIDEDNSTMTTIHLPKIKKVKKAKFSRPKAPKKPNKRKD